MSRDRKMSRSSRIELEFLEKLRQRCPAEKKILKAVGDLYSRVGRFEQGLEIDLELSERFPDDAEVWYNLGCSYALVGQNEASIVALSQAIDRGYDDDEWLRKDQDLRPLRDDPRFELLIARIREAPHRIS